MAKKAKELSALEVGRLTAPGLHFVGGVAGLALQVTTAQSRSWILRVMIGGKRREMGLGGYPDVSLAGAREAARAARAQIKSGEDPIDSAKARRSALAAARAAAITFSEAARLYIAAKEAEWQNSKHADQWRNTLATYAEPLIGHILVSEINPAHILSVLDPIWRTKTETASRLRGRMENILDWARVRGYRQDENPARWRGHLAHMLPAPTKVQQVEHHPSLPYAQLPAFMAALRQEEGLGRWALEFAILTAARSSEVREAPWREIDEDTGIWRIPAARMKMRRDHRVLLSPAALAVLEAAADREGPFMFPGAKAGRPLSDATLTAVIKRMNLRRDQTGLPGWQDEEGRRITQHGFRATFSTWAAHETDYPKEMVEFALSHPIDDAVRAAYQRGDLLEKRRQLMLDWATFCTPTTART